MKKMLNILVLLLTVFVYSQKTETVRNGYYYGEVNGVQLGPRTSFEKAKDDVSDYCFEYGFKTGKVISPGYTITVIPKTENEAGGFVKEDSFKDSVYTLKVIAAYLVGKDSVVTGEIYAQDEARTIFKIDTDSILYASISDEEIYLNLRNYYESFANNKYLVKSKLNGLQPFMFIADTIRSQDSAQTTTQTFFNKHWLFSSREGNRADSLSNWSEFDYSPGTAVLNGFNVRRHSHTFKTKYYQIRALDTTFNIIKTLPLKVNSKFKLTDLKLSNLRIEYTSNGYTPVIAVNGSEPCTMYFLFKEDAAAAWLTTKYETSYDYNSHGINEPRLEAGKSYWVRAIATDINGYTVALNNFITML